MKCQKLFVKRTPYSVTTRAVVWIEINIAVSISCYNVVTTRAVVWIEIQAPNTMMLILAGSPPVRWCGLKYASVDANTALIEVTTRAVVWIEIDSASVGLSCRYVVTTRAVVWIEIRSDKDSG